MTPAPDRISLIFTVLNESGSLPALLDSIASQTRPPDEVIACDGGSADDTVRLLRAETRFPLRVIEAPGANISRGRNIAIAAAACEIIACTDAGVRLEPRWLAAITEPLRGDDRLITDDGQASSVAGRPSWAAGFFAPDPRPGNAFDIAMSATVLPERSDVDPARFLPSSRSVAYLKTAWQEAGGYPEWLDYCEDLVFDLALRARFGPPAFVPEAVAHFRPRTSLKSFFKQYYLYARGDGKAGLWLKRHAIRYATYLVALPALLAGMVALPDLAARIACALLLILGIAAYLRAPYRRLSRSWKALPPWGKVTAALHVPIIRVAGDAAKMIGYPAGVWWRWTRGRRVAEG